MSSALPWLLAALELALVWRLWRGPCYLFPAFGVYMLLSAVTMALWASGLRQAHDIVHATMLPLKGWLVWEALAMQFWFTDDGTPERVRGERYWVTIMGVGVGMLLMALADHYIQLQYNVAAWVWWSKTLPQLGIAAVLFVAWVWAAIKPPKAPIRAKHHLTLLLAWFALALVNLIQFRKGEGELWAAVSTADMVGMGVVLVLWIRLFKFRGDVAA